MSAGMSVSHFIGGEEIKSAGRDREYHYDWTKAQQHSSTTASSGTELNALGWRRPPPEKLKCNVDAACYVEQNKFCIAACVGDKQGSFVKGLAQRFDGTPVIQEAEAIAILEAMK